MAQPLGSGTAVRFGQTSPDAAVFHGVVQGNVMTVYFPAGNGLFSKIEFVWDEDDHRWESGNPNFELYTPSGAGSPPPYEIKQLGVTTSSGVYQAVQ